MLYLHKFYVLFYYLVFQKPAKLFNFLFRFNSSFVSLIYLFFLTTVSSKITLNSSRVIFLDVHHLHGIGSNKNDFYMFTSWTLV